MYERDAAIYMGRELQVPEQRLLGRFRNQWSAMSMLDIGVGAGRTAFTFAPLVQRYVGIDYSERMIELARALVGEEDSIEFRVCDARTMVRTIAERFDLVLFSFNGIDSVGHEDRLEILRQVRAVIKEDGYFFFSSHSLATLPLRFERPGLSPRRPVRSAYRLMKAIRPAVRLWAINSRIDQPAVAERGWTFLRDGAHDFDALLYYVDPRHQIGQLNDARFSVDAIYDLSGRVVSAEDPGRDPWLYYLCRPS